MTARHGAPNACDYVRRPLMFCVNLWAKLSKTGKTLGLGKENLFEPSCARRLTIVTVWGVPLFTDLRRQIQALEGMDPVAWGASFACTYHCRTAGRDGGEGIGAWNFDPDYLLKCPSAGVSNTNVMSC